MYDNAGTFTLDAGSNDPNTTIDESILEAGDKFEVLVNQPPYGRQQGAQARKRRRPVPHTVPRRRVRVTGTSAKANSIYLVFADDGKEKTLTSAGSDLDASSVTPAAFTVSGNSVNSVFVDGNEVYLTLAENLGPDETPSITIASGQIKDKAGNAFGGKRIPKASDGLGPNLSLSKDGDLSKSKVTVTIATDEQLSDLPDVTLTRVIDSDGNLVGYGAHGLR